jgi:16S rRNA processing protein RimM
MLVVGRLGGVYGVRGWLRIVSETDPLENILAYSPWYLGRQVPPVEFGLLEARRVAEGRRHGKGLIARLEGCDDRDQAVALVGHLIMIRRDQLPPPRPDELYWADLEGLAVETVDGLPLGRVSRLFATAANDVLVVQGERERLLPFVWDRCIRDVDLKAGLIRVDWDPNF